MQSQDAFIMYEDLENNENDRYIGWAYWEADEILHCYTEYFEFENFPTVEDVELVLLKAFKEHVRSLDYYIMMNNVNIYDTTTSDCHWNWEIANDEIKLMYKGKFEVYLGHIDGFEVEEI